VITQQNQFAGFAANISQLEANSIRQVQCFAIGMKYFIQALRRYNGLRTFSVHRIPYGGGDLVVKASIS
jgi:hypothetical protein